MCRLCASAHHSRYGKSKSASAASAALASSGSGVCGALAWSSLLCALLRSPCLSTGCGVPDHAKRSTWRSTRRARGCPSFGPFGSEGAASMGAEEFRKSWATCRRTRSASDATYTEKRTGGVEPTPPPPPLTPPVAPLPTRPLLRAPLLFSSCASLARTWATTSSSRLCVCGVESHCVTSVTAPGLSSASPRSTNLKEHRTCTATSQIGDKKPAYGEEE
mmetsp:Transcript_60216/g.136152  ORF Transcript_60216/g.136152 Transcript_60216/m.136152 type:complete len:219 (+) Transcript_60216:188-844(+)